MELLKTFVVKVDLFAGTDIKDASWEMCELANRIGCKIEAKFNSVTLWARPGDNPMQLAKAYEVELKSGKQIKLAQAN